MDFSGWGEFYAFVQTAMKFGFYKRSGMFGQAEKLFYSQEVLYWLFS